MNRSRIQESLPAISRLCHWRLPRPCRLMLRIQRLLFRSLACRHLSHVLHRCCDLRLSMGYWSLLCEVWKYCSARRWPDGGCWCRPREGRGCEPNGTRYLVVEEADPLVPKENSPYLQPQNSCQQQTLCPKIIAHWSFLALYRCQA
jgi:hypothetical protein